MAWHIGKFCQFFSSPNLFMYCNNGIVFLQLPAANAYCTVLGCVRVCQKDICIYVHRTVNIVDRSAFTSSPHNQHMSLPRVRQRLCRPISSEVHAGSDARNILLQGLAIPYQNSSTQRVNSLPSEFHPHKPLTVSAKGPCFGPN